jgi:predicted RNase H-like HicB family nuclease
MCSAGNDEKQGPNAPDSRFSAQNKVNAYGRVPSPGVPISPSEDSYWVAECPSLPGCVSQGATREESIRNIQEAIEGYIAVLRKDGLPVPEDKLEALLLAV